ncbi:unnamed protein product [Mesocestoides corti]|uniref:CXXC motif containing zinc binding protein n=2 Tax=Mesocestoides corti TaxID=53468 RepID=A0A0R3U1X7_MESCO|nr:unnamed protein product [Mesocestoides corti]
MPLFDLLFSARLEGVRELLPSGEDFRWYIKVKCTNCMEEHENVVYVCALEQEPIKGSRGLTNLKLKCKFCGRENSADIVEGSVKAYHEEESEKMRPIVRFECRGLEPLTFSPRVGWRVVSSSNSATVFDDVDLGQGEWADYDEAGDQCVEIFDVTSEFCKVASAPHK